MGKTRKGLRTNVVEMKLHKIPPIDTSAWNIKHAQPFFPPLEKLFKTDTLANLKDYGVRLTDEIQRVMDADHIQVKGKPVEVHRKTTMILSPFKWMRGDYGTIGLPKPNEIASEMQETLQSPHTAGYVGAMTSIALSESGCIHFPKVYGVYVGLATAHTLDISEDYEDLSDRRWFADNVGKTFDLKVRSHEPSAEFKHTRSQRIALSLGEDVELDGIQDMEVEHVSISGSLRSHSHSHIEDSSDEDDDESSDDSEDEFEIHSCQCSDTSDEEEGLDDEGEDEPFAWATFTDVPVITTVMEKCTGTFYDLIEAHTESEKHVAWVSQIVFALAYAQRNFAFTHNDLHGNNVMYVPTTTEFLYYNHDGQTYKVPTFGYLIKIIDFDRAITSLRLKGMKQPRQFVSSQFQSNDEAAGQYNIEPFFNKDYMLTLPPNSSFDLCRFATSVFWDFFPEGPLHPYTHPLFETFKQWMTRSATQRQDESSVLFREQQDRHDRYHGFDLYKAIARYCHKAVPGSEIEKLVLYKIPSVPVGNPCLRTES